MANFDNIIQEINTNLPDNNTQAITAAKLRTTLIDFVNQVDSNEDGIETSINGKQDTLTFDSEPTENSTNPVTSGGIYNAMQGVSSIFESGQEVNEVSIINDLTNGGVDNVLSAEQGIVLSERIKQLDGYFYNVNVNVKTNQQRNKNYTLTPGSKIVVRVSVVSGTSISFNLNWIKPGGNETIIIGYPMGYITDVLTVPNDATGLNIFMTPAATGNVNKVEIFNASRADYFLTRIGNEGITYLDNRKVISKSLNVTTQNQAINIISLNDSRLTPLSGDIYAIISGTAKLKNNKSLRFWNAEDISSPSVSIPGAVLKDGRKIFKIFSSANFRLVDIIEDSFEYGGTLNVTVFSIDSSIEKYNAPLYDRNIMCFGDSLTEFRMSVDNKQYTDYLAELSLSNVSNAGIGGTRLAQRLTPSLTPSDNQTCIAAFDICNLVTSWATNNYDIQDAAIASGLLTETQQTLYEKKLTMLKNNPIAKYNIVTIFGGTNDYTGGSRIGTTDATNTDKGTIYGAVNAMVSALLTAKPTLKIYFFSPIIRMFNSTVSISTSSDVYVHSNAPEGKTLPQFCEVIADAVKLNHIPFCNWYWDFGWNVYNFVTYFGSDYTHPYNGFNVIADKMYKFLLSK